MWNKKENTMISNRLSDSIHSVTKMMTHITTNTGVKVKQSHYLTRSEIDVIKTSWCKLIGDETGSHGINMLINYFKKYPELRNQYFGFLVNMTEEEMLKSPRLNAVGSGMVLGVTQIINGLENPLIFGEVAYKFSKTHFRREIREDSVRLLIPVIMDYLQEEGGLTFDEFTRNAYDKMFYSFLSLVERKMTSMEEERKKEANTKNLRSNVKMLGIALVVLAIEKLCDFLMALLSNLDTFSSSSSTEQCGILMTLITNRSIVGDTISGDKQCQCTNNTVLDHGPVR